MSTAARRRLLTVDEFHAMAETGILAPDERVELINGEILAMSPQGSAHAFSVRRLNRLLGERLYAQKQVHAEITVQSPIVLGDYSEPEPDLALIRPGIGKSRLPGAADVLLVIEVSDVSLDYDRNVKLANYARAGIPEVWIVDVPHQVIHVFRSAAGDAFQIQFEAKESLDVAALPELSAIPVDAVFGTD